MAEKSKRALPRFDKKTPKVPNLKKRQELRHFVKSLDLLGRPYIETILLIIYIIIHFFCCACPWPIQTSPRSPEICKVPVVCSVSGLRPRPPSHAGLCAGPCSQQLGTTSLDLGLQSASGLSPEVWGKEGCYIDVPWWGISVFHSFMHLRTKQREFRPI